MIGPQWPFSTPVSGATVGAALCSPNVSDERRSDVCSTSNIGWQAPWDDVSGRAYMLFFSIVVWWDLARGSLSEKPQKA